MDRSFYVHERRNLVLLLPCWTGLSPPVRHVVPAAPLRRAARPPDWSLDGGRASRLVRAKSGDLDGASIPDIGSTGLLQPRVLGWRFSCGHYRSHCEVATEPEQTAPVARGGG